MSPISNFTWLDYLYYSEFLLQATNKAILNKIITFYKLEIWYLDNLEGRKNELTRAELI